PAPNAIADTAESCGIRTIAVTNAPSVFHFTKALAEGKRHIRAALGMHPELVRTHGHEIDVFLSLLPQVRFIGEIGLDYVTNDQENRRQQRQILATIVESCANAHDKVLTLHSRRAAGDVIDTIGKEFPGVIILHWFSGTPRELK